VLLYGRIYEPAFRLIAVHPDGFADFAFLKARLDRLLGCKGPLQLLHWGCPLLEQYASGRCQSVMLFPLEPERGGQARAVCGQAMVNRGEALAAFADGSPAIEDLIRKARRQRLAVRVVRVPAAR
jgi:hypothetical protein